MREGEEEEEEEEEEKQVFLSSVNSAQEKPIACCVFDFFLLSFIFSFLCCPHLSYPVLTKYWDRILDMEKTKNNILFYPI